MHTYIMMYAYFKHMYIMMYAYFKNKYIMLYIEIEKLVASDLS